MSSGATPARRLLYEMLSPYRRPLAAAGTLTVLTTAAALAVPFLVKRGIDQGVVAGDTSVLVGTTALLVAVALAGAATQWGAERVAGRVAEDAIFDLRQRVGRHIGSLSLDVFDRQRSGRLLAAGTNDIEALSLLLSSAALAVVPSLLYMVGMAVVLVALDWVLAAVVLTVVLPVLWWATARFRDGSRLAYRQVRESSASVVGYVSETLSGIRVVQAFTREPARQNAFDDLNDRQRDAKVYAARFGTGYGPFTLGLGSVALFVVLVVGGFRSLAGATTIGVITAFILYLRQFFNPLQDLTQFHDSYRAADAGLERLADLLATTSSVADADDARPLPEDPERNYLGALSAVDRRVHHSDGPGSFVSGPEGRGAVRLERVDFAYGDRLVLTGVDLEVRAGETLLVLGATGAGKSTLAKLVARFYDPSAGRVLIDGQDLSTTTAASLGCAVAILSQEPYLFRGSVADNIALGRPDARPDEVAAAAEAVGVASLIDALPDGYATKVSPTGGGFSAGQRQLISLARAWLLAPRVIVLDEATSALDLPTEQAVLGALRQLVGGRTAVVISHRLTAVGIADRVAVVDDGRVVELGTPDELLADDTRFRRYLRQWEQGQTLAR